MISFLVPVAVRSTPWSIPCWTICNCENANTIGSGTWSLFGAFQEGKFSSRTSALFALPASVVRFSCGTMELREVFFGFASIADYHLYLFSLSQHTIIHIWSGKSSPFSTFAVFDIFEVFPELVYLFCPVWPVQILPLRILLQVREQGKDGVIEFL